MPPMDAAADPYHMAPADTLDSLDYEGWKHFRVACDRCHGEDGLGTTFGPSVLRAMQSGGSVPTHEAFVALMAAGRPEKGMPPATQLGLTQADIETMYAYLHGRSTGVYLGGRPALRGTRR